MRVIGEREYRRAEADFIAGLREAIRASGLSYNAIARGTRLERRAVSRIAKGLGIRVDAFARIQYFLQEHNKSNTNDD